VTADQWLDDVLEKEGWPAYTNRAADRGGPTKGGITLKTLRSWRAWSADTLPVPTEEDLKVLDRSEARDIFRFWYLTPWGFMDADDPLVALCADWSVTSGPDDPTKALQQALGLAADGHIGPKTRGAYLALDAEGRRRIYPLVWRARLQHYVSIALNERDVRDFMRACPTTQLHNLRGWLNRALSLPATPDAGGGRDPISPDPRSPGAAVPLTPE
jgi:lysozyme family protein